MEVPAAHWSLPVDQLFQQLDSSPDGLTRTMASQRCDELSHTRLVSHRRTPFTILLEQFDHPIIWLLFGSAVLSFGMGEQIDGSIILFILVASGLLGYWQEWSAADAVAKLLAGIETKARVRRDGHAVEIPADTVVPGDIVLLTAGSLIPCDCRIVESKDLFVDEAALTGESYPVEKSPDQISVETPLAQRTNALFLGTHVVSGMATALAVATGRNTEFGRVSARLEQPPPETGFERGLRDFGNLLIRVTLVFVTCVFVIKVAFPPKDADFTKNFFDTLSVALAVAVGMTPQLLPAITSVVLAAGAKSMAASQVIVKRLLAIENFGGMNILCSDKTGTLTEGVVQLHSTPDLMGTESEQVLRCAFLNAALQSGYENPIDQAIRAHRQFELDGIKKLNEIPYDFQRKRLSVLLDDHGTRLMLTKGALSKVLEVCTEALVNGESIPLETHRAEIDEHFAELSRQGFRVLGIAQRQADSEHITKADERGMSFLGFVVLYDPPKPGVLETVQELERLGVQLKIITGDNRTVALAISQQIGLNERTVLTGGELVKLSDAELAARAGQVNLFAEVEPNQKERIIVALKRAGNIVGYMGDGINDASALHAADVGVSVESAVDVAREAAQIVLLKQDLRVLIHGVEEGRRTLANTLKYVFVAVSGNFGYMFSMSVTSLFLSFFALTPAQILLINLMADFPAMTLATDRVDPELIERPRRWDMKFILRFMLVFGLSGTIFDFLTFGILLKIYQASEVEFRTGWFIESMLTGLLIMLLLRTQRPFFQSRPSRSLLTVAAIIGAITIYLPYSPFSHALGFMVPPPSLMALAIAISVLYGVGIEAAKWFFFRRRSVSQIAVSVSN